MVRFALTVMGLCNTKDPFGLGIELLRMMFLLIAHALNGCLADAHILHRPLPARFTPSTKIFVDTVSL